MKYPFMDPPNTACITCCHIMDGTDYIRFVSHDDEDGMWQFLCGRKHETEDARLVSLESIFEIDNSVGELADMPCGHQAERDTENSIWDVSF